MQSDFNSQIFDNAQYSWCRVSFQNPIIISFEYFHFMTMIASWDLLLLSELILSHVRTVKVHKSALYQCYKYPTALLSIKRLSVPMISNEETYFYHFNSIMAFEFLARATKRKQKQHTSKLERKIDFISIYRWHDLENTFHEKNRIFRQEKHEKILCPIY